MRQVVRVRMIAAMAATLASCGGKTAMVGRTAVPANAPEWAAKGSRVEAGSIFGVGAVSGISNTALARDSAANRGRAEISKILETYSASLMKDYQESVTAGSATSDAQLVTQAIKTFSANLLNGTETKDLWLDASKNTWFALVELNFERAKTAASAQAKMSPGLGKWVDENSGRVLSELEGEGRSAAPRPEARDESSGVPEAVPPPSTTPMAQDDGPPARVGGAAPAWTQGRCDRARYLCGVGDGSDRRSADMDARAELARIFQSNIQAVQKSLESAASEISSKTGERWIETQTVSSMSMVSTDKVVAMSEILERWDDGKGKSWSLGVVDREKASRSLIDKIAEKDRIVASKLSSAKDGSDKVARLRSLESAVRAHVEREASNSDLRVIRADGSGVVAPHDIAEMLGLLEGAKEALTLGIALAGTGAERVRECLEQALGEKGYPITSSVDEAAADAKVEGAFDIILRGTVKNEKRGVVAGSEVVETSVTIELVNGKTKKTLRTFRGSEKGSRGSVEAAAATSAFKVCQKKIPEIVSDIDRYFSR